MDELDRAIINGWQQGVPVADRPYRTMARAIGISEEDLIARLGRLLEQGVLTRFGPLYDVEALGGAFTLAAMEVPANEWSRVVAVVNALPEVAHNYAREHRLNMWFVLATENPGQIRATISFIERKTGIEVYDMRKEREYFVGLRLTA